jgi:type VI secretion system secreted protein Hcp
MLVRNRFSVLLLLCVLVILAVPAVAPADEGFLALEGVPGESTARGHEDEIVIDAFSIGVTAGPNARPGGGGSARATFSDLTVQKRLDRSSPSLLKAIATGQRFRKAVLTLQTNGEGPFEYLEYCLTDVRLTKLETSWDGSGVPRETVGFGYSTLVETYSQQNNDGQAVPWVGGFDLVRARLLNTCVT